MVELGLEYLAELESETPATRKCLERIPMNLVEWRPHEKSMAMGYLSLLVAEIPKWITYIVEQSEIDLATFPHARPATTEDLVRHFDENIEGATRALKTITHDELARPFYLKTNGQVVFTSPKREIIRSSLNHWVHHRGQLTVYMRLNNIPVPSIYGPSADDRGF